MLKRYELVLVGNETGRAMPMTFLRFWTRRQAEQWCSDLNAAETEPKYGLNSLDLRPLVHFEVVRRTREAEGGGRPA